MFYIHYGTLIALLPFIYFSSFSVLLWKKSIYPNNPCIQIASENEVLFTTTPELIQSATAKNLSSEIYFTSGAMLRDALKNTFARSNSSFIESTKL